MTKQSDPQSGSFLVNPYRVEAEQQQALGVAAAAAAVAAGAAGLVILGGGAAWAEGDNNYGSSGRSHDSSNSSRPSNDAPDIDVPSPDVEIKAPSVEHPSVDLSPIVPGPSVSLDVREPSTPKVRPPKVADLPDLAVDLQPVAPRVEPLPTPRVEPVSVPEPVVQVSAPEVRPVQVEVPEIEPVLSASVSPDRTEAPEQDDQVVPGPEAPNPDPVTPKAVSPHPDPVVPKIVATEPAAPDLTAAVSSNSVAPTAPTSGTSSPEPDPAPLVKPVPDKQPEKPSTSGQGPTPVQPVSQKPSSSDSVVPVSVQVEPPVVSTRGGAAVLPRRAVVDREDVALSPAEPQSSTEPVQPVLETVRDATEGVAGQLTQPLTSDYDPDGGPGGQGLVVPQGGTTPDGEFGRMDGDGVIRFTPSPPEPPRSDSRVSPTGGDATAPSADRSNPVAATSDGEDGILLTDAGNGSGADPVTPSPRVLDRRNEGSLLAAAPVASDIPLGLLASEPAQSSASEPDAPSPVASDQAVAGLPDALDQILPLGGATLPRGRTPETVTYDGAGVDNSTPGRELRIPTETGWEIRIDPTVIHHPDGTRSEFWRTYPGATTVEDTNSGQIILTIDGDEIPSSTGVRRTERESVLQRRSTWSPDPDARDPGKGGSSQLPDDPSDGDDDTRAVVTTSANGGSGGPGGGPGGDLTGAAGALSSGAVTDALRIDQPLLSASPTGEPGRGPVDRRAGQQPVEGELGASSQDAETGLPADRSEQLPTTGAVGGAETGDPTSSTGSDAPSALSPYAELSADADPPFLLDPSGRSSLLPIGDRHDFGIGRQGGERPIPSVPEDGLFGSAVDPWIQTELFPISDFETTALPSGVPSDTPDDSGVSEGTPPLDLTEADFDQLSLLDPDLLTETEPADGQAPSTAPAMELIEGIEIGSPEWIDLAFQAYEVGDQDFLGAMAAQRLEELLQEDAAINPADPGASDLPVTEPVLDPESADVGVEPTDVGLGADDVPGATAGLDELLTTELPGLPEQNAGESSGAGSVPADAGEQTSDPTPWVVGEAASPDPSAAVGEEPKSWEELVLERLYDGDRPSLREELGLPTVPSAAAPELTLDLEADDIGVEPPGAELQVGDDFSFETDPSATELSIDPDALPELETPSTAIADASERGIDLALLQSVLDELDRAGDGTTSRDAVAETDAPSSDDGASLQDDMFAVDPSTTVDDWERILAGDPPSADEPFRPSALPEEAGSADIVNPVARFDVRGSEQSPSELELLADALEILDADGVQESNPEVPVSGGEPAGTGSTLLSQTLDEILARVPRRATESANAPADPVGEAQRDLEDANEQATTRTRQLFGLNLGSSLAGATLSAMLSIPGAYFVIRDNGRIQADIDATAQDRIEQIAQLSPDVQVGDTGRTAAQVIEEARQRNEDPSKTLERLREDPESYAQMTITAQELNAESLARLQQSRDQAQQALAAARGRNDRNEQTTQRQLELAQESAKRSEVSAGQAETSLRQAQDALASAIRAQERTGSTATQAAVDDWYGSISGTNPESTEMLGAPGATVNGLPLVLRQGGRDLSPDEAAEETLELQKQIRAEHPNATLPELTYDQIVEAARRYRSSVGLGPQSSLPDTTGAAESLSADAGNEGNPGMGLLPGAVLPAALGMFRFGQRRGANASTSSGGETGNTGEGSQRSAAQGTEQGAGAAPPDPEAQAAATRQEARGVRNQTRLNTIMTYVLGGITATSLTAAGTSFVQNLGLRGQQLELRNSEAEIVVADLQDSNGVMSDGTRVSDFIAEQQSSGAQASDIERKLRADPNSAEYLPDQSGETLAQTRALQDELTRLNTDALAEAQRSEDIAKAQEFLALAEQQNRIAERTARTNAAAAQVAAEAARARQEADRLAEQQAAADELQAYNDSVEDDTAVGSPTLDGATIIIFDDGYLTAEQAADENISALSRGAGAPQSDSDTFKSGPFKGETRAAVRERIRQRVQRYYDVERPDRSPAIPFNRRSELGSSLPTELDPANYPGLTPEEVARAQGRNSSIVATADASAVQPDTGEQRPGTSASPQSGNAEADPGGSVPLVGGAGLVWLGDLLRRLNDDPVTAEGTPSGSGADGGGSPEESGGAAGEGRGGGVVITPDDLLRRGSIDDLLDMTFPGGDPRTAPAEPDPAELDRPLPQPREDFDPNDINRGEQGASQEPLAETFPLGDPELEELLDPNGIAGPRFTSPLPRKEPEDIPATEPAVATASVPEPGSTRVGSNGRVQTYVGGQDLVGDGQPGTTRGRVNFYRGEDGRIEAVVVSPRRVDADGTATVWIPNLGTSVASNPGADQVTSVQQVASPEFRPGTTNQAIRIRTGEYTQRLAGGGAGSEAGSVTYRPVPGNERLQDVVVQPSTTVVENADGSRTITYSALVPANRELNAAGTAERYRVAVGTQMRQATRSVFVPAPPPPPVAEVYEPSPALTGAPSVSSPANPGYVAPTPEPGMRGEPSGAYVEQPDPSKVNAGLSPVYDEGGRIVEYVPADPAVRQMQEQIYIPYLGPAPGVGVPLPLPAGGGQLAPAY